MKFLDDFFHIVSEANEGEYRCRVRMNPAHRIFAGHFPGNPVVPGACLIQMASEILENHLGKKLFLQKAPHIKFKVSVKPEDELDFTFSAVTLEEDSIKAEVNVEKGETVFAKMTIRFKCAD